MKHLEEQNTSKAMPAAATSQSVERCPECLSDSREQGNMVPCRNQWHGGDASQSGDEALMWHHQQCPAASPPFGKCDCLMSLAASQPSQSEEGERTEQVIADDAVQAKIRQHPVLVVCGLIVRGNEVLLEHRAPSDIGGAFNMWDLPGGKVECGETPEQAIVRELREELNVEVKPLRLLPSLKRSVWKYQDVDRHWILACYVCTIMSGEPQYNERLQWFDIESANSHQILSADLEFIREYAASQSGEGEQPEIDFKAQAALYRKALEQIARGNTAKSYEYDPTPTEKELALKALVDGQHCVAAVSQPPVARVCVCGHRVHRPSGVCDISWCNCESYRPKSQPPVAQNETLEPSKDEVRQWQTKKGIVGRLMVPVTKVDRSLYGNDSTEYWDRIELEAMLQSFAADYARQSQERIAELERDLEVQKAAQQCLIESNHNNFVRAETAELAAKEAGAKALEDAANNTHLFNEPSARIRLTTWLRNRAKQLRSHSTV